MFFAELPLALFTLLAQLAVGIILVGQCMLTCGVAEELRQPIRKQTLVAFVLFAVAAIISLLHTGTPLHSPYTLLNVGTSWLSREIAAMGLTGAALLWLAFLRTKKTSSQQEGVASLLVIITGFILIYSMSRVYTQPTTPGWNHAGVGLSFFAASFMLGAAWQAATLACASRGIVPLAKSGVNPVVHAVLWAVFGFVLMASAIAFAMPDQSLAINPATSHFPYACQAPSHFVHALVSGFGLLVLVFAAMRSLVGKKLSMCLALLGFIALFGGELFGRLVFYASYTRLGM